MAKRKLTPWHIIFTVKDGRKLYVTQIMERGQNSEVKFSAVRENARYYQDAGSAIHDAKWIGLAFKMATSIEKL